MNIKRELNDLLNVCINHFDDICTDDSKRIYVFSITLENHDIWGGTGEHDTSEMIYITKDGWLSETVTTETGLYQKSNPVINTFLSKLTSEYVEKIINGNKTSMSEVISLTDFYQKIRKEYFDEFHVY